MTVREAPLTQTAPAGTYPSGTYPTRDAELIAHQETWIGFTRFVKYATGAVLVLVAFLGLTLVA